MRKRVGGGAGTRPADVPAIEAPWAARSVATEVRALVADVGRLRSENELGRLGRVPIRIATVHAVGYRLEGVDGTRDERDGG